MTFAQYQRESGFAGSLDDLLERIVAPQTYVDSLAAEVLRAADRQAWNACQGGSGGSVITLGQIALATGRPIRAIAREAGIAQYMGETI